MLIPLYTPGPVGCEQGRTQPPFRTMINTESLELDPTGGISRRPHGDD